MGQSGVNLVNRSQVDQFVCKMIQANPCSAILSIFPQQTVNASKFSECPPKRPDTFENLIEIKRVDENN